MYHSIKFEKIFNILENKTEYLYMLQDFIATYLTRDSLFKKIKQSTHYETFSLHFSHCQKMCMVTYIHSDWAAVVGVPRHVTGMLKLVIPLDQGVVTHHDVRVGWLVPPGFTEVILFYQFFLQLHGGKVSYSLPNTRMKCFIVQYKYSLTIKETKVYMRNCDIKCQHYKQ